MRVRVQPRDVRGQARHAGEARAAPAPPAHALPGLPAVTLLRGRPSPRVFVLILKKNKKKKMLQKQFKKVVLDHRLKSRLKTKNMHTLFYRISKLY